MIKPSAPGVYLVRGHRFTSRRRMRVAVNDIVDVQEVDFVRPKRLAVYFFGRARPFNLSEFDAEWTPVRIDFGGERCA